MLAILRYPSLREDDFEVICGLQLPEGFYFLFEDREKFIYRRRDFIAGILPWISINLV